MSTALPVFDPTRREIEALLDRMPDFAKAPNDGWEKAVEGRRGVGDYPSTLAWAMGRLIQGGFGENPVEPGRRFDELAQETMDNVILLYGLGSRGRTSIEFLAAVDIISQGWKYGRIFRQWHSRVYEP